MSIIHSLKLAVAVIVYFVENGLKKQFSVTTVDITNLVGILVKKKVQQRYTSLRESFSEILMVYPTLCTNKEFPPNLEGSIRILLQLSTQFDCVEKRKDMMF